MRVRLPSMIRYATYMVLALVIASGGYYWFLLGNKNTQASVKDVFNDAELEEVKKLYGSIALYLDGIDEPFLDMVTHVASKQGVILESVDWKKCPYHESVAELLKAYQHNLSLMTISIKGSWSNLASFIADIEASPYVMVRHVIVDAGEGKNKRKGILECVVIQRERL